MKNKIICNACHTIFKDCSRTHKPNKGTCSFCKATIEIIVCKAPKKASSIKKFTKDEFIALCQSEGLTDLVSIESLWDMKQGEYIDEEKLLLLIWQYVQGYYDMADDESDSSANPFSHSI